MNKTQKGHGMTQRQDGLLAWQAEIGVCASIAMFALLFAAAAAPSDAFADAACSTEIENGSCSIRITRGRSVSPLPVRVRPDATVTLDVERLPLEKVAVDEAAALTPEPDVLAGVFQRLSDPLKSLTLKVKTNPPNTFRLDSILRQYSAEIRSTHATCKLADPTLCDQIAEIEARQSTVQEILEAWRKNSLAAVNEIKIAKTLSGDAKKSWEARWSAPASSWSDDATLEAATIRTRTSLTSDASPECTREAVALATCTLPTRTLADAAGRLAMARDAYGRLAYSADKSYVDARERLANAIAVHEYLEVEIGRLLTAQAELKALHDVLVPMKAGDFSPGVRISIPGLQSNGTSQLKLSATDPITKKATSLGTANVLWQRQPWEMSIGFWISTLAKRSFARAPVVVNGVQTVVNNVAQTQLVETTARPTVVPGVMVHRRLRESDLGSRRGAWLGSIAVGVNNSTTEYGVGVTYSVGNFMVTPMLHVGRDTRLTSGLTVGMQNPPADISALQRKFWAKRFAVGFTYKVPIP